MTLQKIARLARVSIATVSRTINRVPSVDPVLARRVWRVIEKQGYYPNRHARSLVSGRSRIFGLMVPEAPNAFFPEIIQTFARLCIQHNYQVLLSAICQDARLLETAARQMIERRVDGVAILTFREQESLVEIFRDRNVSVFVIDSDRPGPLLRSVCIDYQHGIRQAVQHLAALGHTRIAFVSGPAHLKTAAVQKNAFHACMKEIGLQVAAEILLEGDHTMEAGAEAASSLVSLRHRPSAVVCSNDLMAIGLMHKASELYLDIPGDLSVVGFEDIPFAQYMIPQLTTVQISREEIATVAFEALFAAADPAVNGDTQIANSIATNLVVRGSTSMGPGRVRDGRRSRAGRAPRTSEPIHLINQ